MTQLRTPLRNRHVGRRALLAGLTSLTGMNAGSAYAAEGDWLREGDLSQVPSRRTDKLPLSDQNDTGKWVVDPDFTDEFNGESLDKTKWVPTNPEWPGRPPGAFLEKNVRVSDGKLHLDLRSESLRPDLEHRGYHGWSTAAIQSRKRVLYGYFEVCSKPMDSRAASTFWFYASDPNEWTEIDVYEVWPGLPSRERLYSTNLHVFGMPGGKPDNTSLGLWTAPFDIAADFHVYGLEWNSEFLQFFVDGVLIRRKVNTHWHQALTLNLDVETMPTVAGLPEPSDEVKTYSIDYVRAFKMAG